MTIHYPVSRPSFGVAEIAGVARALDQGQLSQGPAVRQFEADFAAAIGARYAIATMNGTVALHLALAALGIGPGDEVLVPALTFVATANAVTYCGATPVICDVDPATWCLSPDEVRRLGTPRTRAIIPVHLYGNLADVPRLARAARDLEVRYGHAAGTIAIVEDAAQAHGATLNGCYAGTLGRLGTFSFYGNKILTTGEGGMVVTNDAALAERCYLLRGQGMDPDRRYYHPVLGYNYRMTELQGALGVGQVADFAAHVEARRQIRKWYRAALDKTGIEFVWQQAIPGSDPAWWLNTLLLPAQVVPEAAAAALLYRGIETRPAFICLHHLPMYQQASGARPLVNAEMIAEGALSFPTYRGLTEADVEEICQTLLGVL